MTGRRVRATPIQLPLDVSTKVAAGALAGALSVVVVWLIGLTGLDVPPEVAVAVSTIVSAFAGYMVPDPRRKPAPDWAA